MTYTCGRYGGCKNIVHTPCSRCYVCKKIEKNEKNLRDTRCPCQAKKKDGTPCTNKAQDNEIYCGTHLNKDHNTYNGIRCSDCGNYKPDVDKNNPKCKDCIEMRNKINIRATEKNKKEIIICCGKTQKGTDCTFKALDGEKYCDKHLKCENEKEYNRNNNIKVCSVNGCKINVFGTGFNTCEGCRKDDSKKSKERRDKIEKENKEKTETKICKGCPKRGELPLSEFTTDSKYSDEITYCRECREKKQKVDNGRKERIDKKKNLTDKITLIKKSAKKRNIEFNLEKKDAEKLLTSPCFYCEYISDEGLLGSIDRIDSKKPYNLDNCISCCNICNVMKGSLDINTFIKRCEHICTYRGLIEGKLYPELFAIHIADPYCQYKYRAKKKKEKNEKIDFEMTETIFNKLQKKPCYLCGKKTNKNKKHKNGIDRVDSTLGYIENNIESCCGECNFMKNEFDLDNFLEKCLKNYQLNSEIADQLCDNYCINHHI